MKALESCAVKAYDLSAAKSLPDFFQEAAKTGYRRLKKDVEFQKRLELVQDLEFNTTSGRVRLSKDGEYIAATGTYPPVVKIFETRQLGMKCLRGLDSEVVDFQFLSEDYRKLALIMSDRTVEFHSQGGRYFRVRTPKVCRCLEYLQETAELLMAGSSSCIYRLDLEEGVFEAPMRSTMEAVNCLKDNPTLGPVVAAGGADGDVEIWDMRSPKKPQAILHTWMDEDDLTNGKEVTCMDFSYNGLHLATGMTSGIIRVYDIRSTKPLYERDLKNGLKVVDLSILRPSPRDRRAGLLAQTLMGGMAVAACDRKEIKIFSSAAPMKEPSLLSEDDWGAPTSADRTSLLCCIPSPYSLNSLLVVPGSGLILAGRDHTRVGTYFVPEMGLAPRWCSFLDSLTEELEESKRSHSVSEDFKFVTRETLQQIGAEHLIGSSVVRPHMHGFMMPARLFFKIKVASAPDEVQALRKKMVEERMEKRKPMRIKMKKPAEEMKVNQELAERLAAAADNESKKKKRKHAEAAKALLNDPRFKDLFSNPDFAIGESQEQDYVPAVTTASTKRVIASVTKSVGR